ncbi:MAG: hypothetical protein PVG96_01630 [Desulfobacterales bacterium]
MGSTQQGEIALAMGIDALSVKCTDQSGYRLRQDELQVMVVNRFIIKIFMGVYRRHITGPGKPSETRDPQWNKWGIIWERFPNLDRELMFSLLQCQPTV